jgi:hypothetical protein
MERIVALSILNPKMSYNKKPFCKVCQDAGKSESEYTNHWVKDLNGKITCPTLLNTECRFCHKLGHTTKFCKELEKMNKDKKISSQVKKPAKQEVVAHKKPVNSYAVLDESESEEEEEAEAPEEPAKNVWASIAAKPKHVEVVIQTTGFITLSKNTKLPTTKLEPVSAPTPTPEPTPKPMKRWADFSDDEEDEEYGYEDDTW